MGYAGTHCWRYNGVHIDGTQARLPTTPGSDRSQLVLMIYRPGTLDADVPYCTRSVLNRYAWSIGANALQTVDCSSPTQGTINAGGNGNVNKDKQVNFAPGGDFAWAHRHGNGRDPFSPVIAPPAARAGFRAHAGSGV